MDAVLNALCCLMALGVSMFLWRKPVGVYKDGALLVLFLLLFILFSYLTVDVSDGSLEYMPFRMLALSICFSTTSLEKHKIRYLVLAQVLWLWIEFFGGVTFAYRGFDISWVRIVAIGVGAFGSAFLSNITREMEFLLMVYWIAVWMFF